MYQQIDISKFTTPGPLGLYTFLHRTDQLVKLDLYLFRKVENVKADIVKIIIALNCFSKTPHRRCLTELYFRNIFPIGALISLWPRGFTIFQSKIPKWLLSNFQAVNTREDSKRRQIVPVLQ